LEIGGGRLIGLCGKTVSIKCGRSGGYVVVVSGSSGSIGGGGGIGGGSILQDLVGSLYTVIGSAENRVIESIG
jgi:hypothetical protein